MANENPKLTITLTGRPGSYEYRVTSNGETVHIQKRKGGCISYKTKRTLTQAEWDAVYNQNFDAYNNNPAVLARIIDSPYWDIDAPYCDLAQ